VKFYKIIFPSKVFIFSFQEADKPPFLWSYEESQWEKYEYMERPNVSLPLFGSEILPLEVLLLTGCNPFSAPLIEDR